MSSRSVARAANVVNGQFNAPRPHSAFYVMYQLQTAIFQSPDLTSDEKLVLLACTRYGQDGRNMHASPETLAKLTGHHESGKSIGRILRRLVEKKVLVVERPASKRREQVTYCLGDHLLATVHGQTARGTHGSDEGTLDSRLGTQDSEQGTQGSPNSVLNRSSNRKNTPSPSAPAPTLRTGSDRLTADDVLRLLNGKREAGSGYVETPAERHAAKDLAQLVSHGQLTAKELERRFDAFRASEKPFHANRGHSLAHFLTCLNDFGNPERQEDEYDRDMRRQEERDRQERQRSDEHVRRMREDPNYAAAQVAARERNLAAMREAFKAGMTTRQEHTA